MFLYAAILLGLFLDWSGSDQWDTVEPRSNKKDDTAVIKPSDDYSAGHHLLSRLRYGRGGVPAHMAPIEPKPHM